MNKVAAYLLSCEVKLDEQLYLSSFEFGVKDEIRVACTLVQKEKIAFNVVEQKNQ